MLGLETPAPPTWGASTRGNQILKVMVIPTMMCEALTMYKALNMLSTFELTESST